MKYANGAAFRMALEQRLTNQSVESTIPVIRLRRLVVFDRLMARLSIVAADRWVLKGGIALQYRLGPQFRTTRDLDLGRRDDADSAYMDFVAARRLDIDDFFTFTLNRTHALDNIADGSAVRYHLTTHVAGREFDTVRVDVGFSRLDIAEAEIVEGPNLLRFADIEPVAVPTLRIEQHIAEKVHAYSRVYPGVRQSTRVKDLVDIVAVLKTLSFEAGKLRKAIEGTFQDRGTHEIPPTFPPPPVGWNTPYISIAREVGLNTEIAIGYRQASEFLNPILANQVPGEAMWTPNERRWVTGP